MPDAPGPLAVRAAVHARRSEREAAMRIVRELQQRSTGVSLFYVPAIFVLLGERDSAFAALDHARRVEPAWLISMRVEPWLAALRDDPRFERVAREVGHGSE